MEAQTKHLPLKPGAREGKDFPLRLLSAIQSSLSPSPPAVPRTFKTAGAGKELGNGEESARLNSLIHLEAGGSGGGVAPPAPNIPFLPSPEGRQSNREATAASRAAGQGPGPDLPPPAA